MATEEHASALLVVVIRALPDRRYEVLEELSEALGPPGEHRT